MRKPIVLQLGALCAGIAGFGLRKWQMAAAYDPETELFVRGEPATYALVCLLVLLAAVCALLSRKLAPREIPSPPVCARPVYMTLMAAGGFLFFAAGGLGLLDGMDYLQMWQYGLVAVPLSYPMAMLLYSALALACGIAVLVMGKSVYRGGESANPARLSVLPPFAMLIWLFATHQAHATDPVFLRYGLTLLGIILVLFVHYDVAALYQKQPHPRRMLLCATVGTALLLTGLADGPAWSQVAMTAACVLTAQAQCYAALNPAPPAVEEAAPAEPDPEL